MSNMQKAERAATLVQSIKNQQTNLTLDERRLEELTTTIEARKKSIKAMTEDLDNLFDPKERPPFQVNNIVHDDLGTGFRISHIEKRSDGKWWIRSYGSGRWYEATGFTLD